jgi:hypothetical protein
MYRIVIVTKMYLNYKGNLLMLFKKLIHYCCKNQMKGTNMHDAECRNVEACGAHNNHGASNA